MSKEIQAAQLPAFLLPRDIGNMSPDDPRYIRPDFVYLRDDTGEVFLDERDILPKDARRPELLLGRVGIMRAAIIDDEQLITGYVADIRFTNTERFDTAPPQDMPDDQEEMGYWVEDTEHLLPIAAFTYTDSVKEKKTVACGDSRFAEAALHLAKLNDQLNEKIKKQEAKKTAKIKVQTAKKKVPETNKK